MSSRAGVLASRLRVGMSGSMPPVAAAPYGTSSATRCARRARRRLAGYEQIEAAARAAGAPDRQLLTLRFGLAYERAVLGWFDGLPDLAGQ